MNFEKALNILGLQPDFTEVELKKAHRELVNKYHPDINPSPDAEEKTKEINAARECLAKHLKFTSSFTNSYSNSHSSSEYTEQSYYQDNANDIDGYCFKKMMDLENITGFNFNKYSVSHQIKTLIEKIHMIRSIFFQEAIRLDNIDEINVCYKENLKHIEQIFVEIKQQFYRENNINEREVEETITYNCTLEEFYKSLLTIKNKHNKEFLIEKKYRALSNLATFNLDEFKKHPNIKSIIERIRVIPESFNAMVENAQDKDYIEIIYNNCCENIAKLFKELEQEFFKEFSINEQEIEDKLDYNVPLKEFCEQLLNIKSKYSQEGQTEKLLEEETAKYISFPGYKKIQALIRHYKNEALKKIKGNQFISTEKEIIEMHKSILEVFHQYNFIQQKIMELEFRITKIDDEEIKSDFQKIKDKFKTTIRFDELENRIKELENKLNKDYDALKNAKKINDDKKINSIYDYLLTRYNDASKQYNPESDQAELANLNNFLDTVLDLFRKGKNEKKGMEFFNKFNEIDFINYEYNNVLIAKIKNILNIKSPIYIKTKFDYPFEKIGLFYFDEENMLMHKLPSPDSTNDELSIQILKSDLEENYISIDEFISKAAFIGESGTDVLDREFDLLYELNGYALYLENSQFCIGYTRPFIKESRKYNTYLDQYQNKNYVIDIINQQVEKELKEKFSHKI